MKGHLHPMTQFMRATLKYFCDRGFDVVETPEMETEWDNFDALNVPKNHPSRDVQDTFWLKNGNLLRTHTTAGDANFVTANKLKPPFRLIIPGRCYRNEATDQTHNYNFYQFDGIAVGENLNMTHLIGVLEGYIKNVFGETVEIRVRPAHFDFVEPGLEIDMKTKDGKWMEMLGAGMGHPNVLKSLGIDPEKYQAVMFGPGIDRFAMQFFHLDDIRQAYTGDLRFNKQF